MFRTRFLSKQAVWLLMGLLFVGVTACEDGSDTNAGSGGPRESTGSEPVVDPGDRGEYDPEIDPAAFTDVIDNPYLPLSAGARWVYEGESDGETERVEVLVTPERREVMGVKTVVVRDTVSVGGEVVEDTYDWFAQDRDGNVWYFGEESRDYENGEIVSTGGSWEAGVDGASPGIVMPADPAVGDVFRQEYYPGEAEDMFEVVRVDARSVVPIGTFDSVVETEDWTPLEPELVEHKYYAPSVGLVAEETTAGGKGRLVLVEFSPGG